MTEKHSNESGENIFFEDENITNFIQNTLGEARINEATLFPLTGIYGMFLIVGVSGNMATCMVIMSNEYMMTATNVYLINLAITDIATLAIGKRKMKQSVILLLVAGSEFFFSQISKIVGSLFSLHLYFDVVCLPSIIEVIYLCACLMVS